MSSDDPTMSSASGHRVQRLWLTLVGTVVLLATGIVAGYEISSYTHAEFPHSMPGTDTNVSYQEAFRHHDIHLPSDASDLEYDAESKVEGYPVDAEFAMPCTESGRFVQSNHLTQVASYHDLDVSLELFVTERGWILGSTHNRWYMRTTVGSSAKLQVLIDQSSTCHVYLGASD